MHIISVEAVPWDVTMRQPFVTALGAKTRSPNIWVRVRLSDGSDGYGEGSASLAMPQETQTAMLRTVEALAPLLPGQPLTRWDALRRRVWTRGGAHPAATAAVETALFDALTRAWRIPLYQWLGGAATRVETGLTISAWPAAHAAAVARRALRRGFRQFKIKVGSGALDADVERVLAVRRAAPRARLLLDANQGWSVRETEQCAHRLRRARVPIALIEQPLPAEDLTGLAHLTRRLRVPIAVDETVQTPADALRVVRCRAAHVINIKLAKSGLTGALAIGDIARAAGLRLMIGCMAESHAGLAASIHLACGTGAFAYIDLDSHLLTQPAPARGGFIARGPHLTVFTTRPGTGVTCAAHPRPAPAASVLGQSSASGLRNCARKRRLWPRQRTHRMIAIA